MHQIRLKRAQNLCNGLSQEECKAVLIKNGFSKEEIIEYLEQVDTKPDEKTDDSANETTKQKSKLSLKDLETPEGWAKYKELALQTTAYLMCEHIKVQLTRVVGYRHDAQLNKEMYVSHIKLDKETPIGESLISPIMAETLNSQIDGNGGSMVYLIQKSIVC